MTLTEAKAMEPGEVFSWTKSIGGESVLFGRVRFMKLLHKSVGLGRSAQMVMLDTSPSTARLVRCDPILGEVPANQHVVRIDDIHWDTILDRIAWRYARDISR